MLSYVFARTAGQQSVAISLPPPLHSTVDRPTGSPALFYRRGGFLTRPPRRPNPPPRRPPLSFPRRRESMFSYVFARTAGQQSVAISLPPPLHSTVDRPTGSLALFYRRGGFLTRPPRRPQPSPSPLLSFCEGGIQVSCSSMACCPVLRPPLSFPRRRESMFSYVFARTAGQQSVAISLPPPLHSTVDRPTGSPAMFYRRGGFLTRPPRRPQPPPPPSIILAKAGIHVLICLCEDCRSAVRGNLMRISRH
ncbi:hypothetical protein Dform_01691 [Dehalogenimonas formicexedens]|uniref:Uncharacterized protein n=1 Tax=Dehalogenimonas formicexedens TaxID=1839801 RepID=A0A1P8F963_9CHLR|nr:hypothetical protein Dform_01691 [Dehalogenimonas formicexedens]